MTPSAADLRAQIARQRALIYPIAAQIGLHPTRLGAVLNERLPLTPDMARRIQQALQRSTRSA
ncbi:MAG: hypothetical protein ACREM3_05255 [Candidatus Rokuibacteriota bacterium]